MQEDRPLKRTEDLDAAAFLPDGGEMGKLIQSMDWSKTPLGPIQSWPQSLRTTVSLCLASNFPISIAWGPQRVQIYNDGYWPICGAKHPRSMGQDFKECWFSAWPAVGEAFERARAGESTFVENRRMFLDRYGYLEETFFTFSFSPIRDESGNVGGLFHPVTEMTQQTLSERRLKILRDLADRTAEAKTVEAVCTIIVQTLAVHDLDLPFTLLYLLDEGGKQATLAGSAGIEPESPAAPKTINFEEPTQPSWPLVEALDDRKVMVVEDVIERFGPLNCGPYPESPQMAFILPVIISGHLHTYGFLVAGVSSRRAIEESYRTFYLLLREAVTNAFTNALAYEEERRRAEALAKLDQAKTAFFSNVSHEFRTPLTLMLGPVEEMLEWNESKLASQGREQIEVVHRNGLRLLKLVNTMLDFTRIEAGRIHANFEPVELAGYTAELAGVFRAAVERAGLRLVVDCPPLPDPVYVDREMWEKIVLNLLSNAFKFTLEGEIQVKMEAADGQAWLTVQDTGVGIPAEELPNVFKRFYRVKDSRGRTHEGSGIGLALVREMVRLHGGDVRVESMVDDGSRFIVTVPFGKAHLDPKQIRAGTNKPQSGIEAEAIVQEALHDAGHQKPHIRQILEPVGSVADQGDSEMQARILWADDNADMREYISRLLSERFEVEAVADGEAALEAARANPPDLVLSDIMMPKLDGFGLLSALRNDPELRDTPIILLSARAGEEARIEGMEAGADDYLIKPFSARELLARVESHLSLSRLRKETSETLIKVETRFRDVFEKAGVSMWLEDFTEVKKNLDNLRAQGVEDILAYVQQEPDFVSQAVELVRVVDVNAETLELFGARSKADLLGSLSQVFLPETEAIFVQELVALWEGRESVRAETPLRTLEKHPLWVLFTIHLGHDTSDYSRVVVTMTDITERKQVEEALTQLNETLEGRVEERTQQVRELASRLTMAEQEERRRISQILHDDLQQLLSAIGIKLSMIYEDLEVTEQTELLNALKEGREWIQNAIATTRHLTVDLSPMILKKEGLTDALEWLQHQMFELHNLQVDIEAEHSFYLPDEDLRVLLFQIVRELLFNVKKHAGVNHALVSLAEEPDYMVIQVSDEGRGFKVEEKEGLQEGVDGYGLYSIRERLRLLGGQMIVVSEPGKGTQIEVRVPASRVR